MNVSGSVTPGSYNFLAVGTSGALIRTQPMTLVVSSVNALPFALAVDTAGNDILEANETVDVAPTWRNVGTTAITLTGVSSGFTGPAGPTYTNPDTTASYGTIPVNGAAVCIDCYSVAIAAADAADAALGHHHPRTIPRSPPRRGPCTSARASPTCRPPALSIASWRRSCTRT